MNECDILWVRTYPDPSYIFLGGQELRNGDPPEKLAPRVPSLRRSLKVIETDTDRSGTYDFLQ